LVKGELAGRNRFRRLLLGRKSVGKTALLDAIQSAASDVFGDRIVLCNINYGYRPTPVLPSQAILQAAGLAVPDGSRPATYVDEQLKKAGKFVFLVVDELQFVYEDRDKYPEGRQMIMELLSIGDSAAGRIHCVITGSSSNMRRLCFGKLHLTDEIRQQYPNYTRQDMNSTKYMPVWIYPMLDNVDFNETCKLLSVAPSAQLYLSSCGIPGLLREQPVLTSTFSMHTVGVKHYQSNATGCYILDGLWNAMQNLHGTENHAEDELPTYTTRLLHYTLFRQHCDTKNEPTDYLAVLYEMVDAGVVRYDDYVNQAIGFASPFVYFQLLNREEQDVTLVETMALQYPVGQPYDHIAEFTALRLLSKAAMRYTELFGFLLTAPFEKEQIVLQKPFNVADLHEKRIYKELLKPGSQGDALGADACIFVKDGNKYDVHRVQVKLGGTRNQFTKQKVTTEVIKRFKETETVWVEACKRCNIPVSKQILYLVTTRPIMKEARAELDAAQIRQLSGPVLTKFVWPEVVKSLGKQFNVEKDPDM
jgi:hypothetical protein